MSHKVLSYREWRNVMDSEDAEFRHLPFDEKDRMYEDYLKRAVITESQVYGNDCPRGGCE